jgi:hypothetical protein
VAEWDDLIGQTGKLIDEGALDKAAEGLARLKELQEHAEKGSGTSSGKRFPTPFPAERVASLEERLGLQSAIVQLRPAIGMLASPKREEVRAAQDQLFARPDAAIVLLKEATHGKDPILVRNALEMLRMLRQPATTLPIMVDVLRRPEQEANWPDVVTEIGRAAGPGAGAPLLALVVSSELPAQRAAALEALAGAADPPPETVAALLPLLFDDGPQLAAALRAANHAVLANRQHGLLLGRAIEAAVSPEQWERLRALPSRLSAIVAADSGDPPGQAASAAKTLGISLRQMPAEPLRGVTVLAFSAESDDSPAAAVLDGQWNTVDPKGMWRHPVKSRGSIILDLGAERTVAGVRIWNLNESGGGHRGWKDVAVYVGSTTSGLLIPVATGTLPQAPGAADAPDFSAAVPVNFAHGRYVRLEAGGVWRDDQHSGLTEVEVLGY